MFFLPQHAVNRDFRERRVTFRWDDDRLDDVRGRWCLLGRCFGLSWGWAGVVKLEKSRMLAGYRVQDGWMF